MIAVLLDAGLDVGRIRRRHRRFRHQEGGADLAIHQRTQPFALLLLGAVAHEHFHIAGVWRGTVEDFRSPGDVAHLLREQRIFEIGQARAAEFVVLMLVWRHEHVPEAFGLRLLLEVFQDWDHLPAIAALVLLVVDRHRRAHVLGHEGLHAVEPFLLLGRQIEIHGTLLVSLFCKPLLCRTVLPPALVRKRECIACGLPRNLVAVALGSLLRIDFSRSSNDGFIQLFELQLPP
ncbi:hypothetical protein ACVWXO_007184 [Bradyrhizobium sp. LM2.7]